MNLILPNNKFIKIPRNTLLYNRNNTIQNIGNVYYGHTNAMIKLYNDYKVMHTCTQDELTFVKYADNEYRCSLIGGENYWIVGNVNIFSKDGSNISTNIITVTLKYYNENQPTFDPDKYINKDIQTRNTSQCCLYLNEKFDTSWSANGYISVYVENEDVVIDAQGLQCFNFTMN